MPKLTRVTLFTTSRCPHCKQVSALLRQENIRFQTFDIEKSRRAAVEFQRAGGRSVPLLLIGEQKIVGADQKKIRKTLTAAGLIRA